MDITIEQAKQNMISQQVRAGSVLDSYLLTLYNSLPREFFIDKPQKKLAYAELNVPIGHGQVMMRPNEEARMLQALAIKPTNTVLEIGTGTGFITAMLANLGQHVFSIDIFPEFIAAAQQRLTQLIIKNVSLHCADAAKGWNKHAPYDVICITASVRLLPKIFLENLAPEGRLFVILGDAPAMSACLFTRAQNGEWHRKNLFETVLPPLINAPEPEAFTF